jgi:flagellar basal-body rod modification protein FlgD
MAEMSVTQNINDLLPSTASITQLESSQELGKEDFLNLLVAEIQNQNPLEPMDNKDLVLQLSQFSTLEGTQNLNDNMSSFIDTNTLGTASSLIGKEVVYLALTETGAFEAMGTVDKVNMSDGEVTLVVSGDEVGMNQLISVYNPTEAASE